MFNNESTINKCKSNVFTNTSEFPHYKYVQRVSQYRKSKHYNVFSEFPITWIHHRHLFYPCDCVWKIELWKKDSIENGLLFLCWRQLFIAFLTNADMHAFEVITINGESRWLFKNYWGIMN